MAMLLRAMRLLGAVAILAVGAIHLQQYIGADYRAIPTVGTLFLLNAIGSAIAGIGLLAPINRVAVDRADAAIAALALAALTIAIGSLVALFISESGGLFGFTESGYRTPVVVAIVAEAATLTMLGPVAAMKIAHVLSRRRRKPSQRRSGATSRPDYGAAN